MPPPPGKRAVVGGISPALGAPLALGSAGASRGGEKGADGCGKRGGGHGGKSLGVPSWHGVNVPVEVNVSLVCMAFRIHNPSMAANEKPYLWQLTVLVLSLVSLGFIAAISFQWVNEDVAAIMAFGDFAICCVFLADFFVGLAKAPSKREFMRWGWVDLVSSIPALPFLRLGRLARVLRILRVLRGLRSASQLRQVLRRSRSRSAFAIVGLISFLAVLMGAILILEFEREGGNIANGEEALWWAFVTMTTVGYGDFFPVSLPGRVVAAVLMLLGIGLFGTFTGYVASWFEETENAKDEDRDERILTEIEALRAEVKRLTGAIDEKHKREP